MSIIKKWRLKMRKNFVLSFLVVCILLTLFASTVLAEEEIELRFLGMAQAAYSEQNVNDMTADFMKDHPNIKVSTEFVPYEELRNKTMLAYGSSNSYDAALVDDIWFAEYAAKDMLLDITADIPQEYKDGVLAGAWNVTTKNGKILGVPWFLDTMYLFYNKDMLSKAGFEDTPKSIEEMVEMAKVLKEKGIVEYPFVFSMAQAEALICVYANFLEAYGQSFQDAEGNYILQDSGVETLEFLVSLMDEGLLNPNSLEFLEEDVRRVFSSGDAAFTLNWAYMYALAKDPAESSLAPEAVGIMTLPGKEGIKEHAAMSGSMGLGVLSKSAHPKEALEYILYLSSKGVQDTYSNLQLPVWTASYDDPQIAAGREDMVAAAKQAFSIMNVRPSEPNYQEASAILQKNIQSALYGDVSAKDALTSAIDEINQIK
jgi:multiple sugar transport system substrate-binding protein